MKCSLSPRENFVVLDRFKEEEVSPGGVIIPEVSRIQMDSGKVVAIGPGKYGEYGDIIPIDGLKIGDVVHFAANAGVDIPSCGKIYYLLPSVNIIAVENK